MKQSDNRETLLQTALELFAARSYDAVGVQEIVTRAGVTKPTLYHYFGSKEGLLQALLERNYGSMLSGLGQAAAYQGDLIKSLTELAGCWITQARACEDFFHLRLGLAFLPVAHPTRRLIAPWQEQIRQVLEALFIAAVPQHGNLRGHHTLLALSLQGQLDQATRALLADELPAGNDLVYRLVKQYMYGIYVL